MPCFTIYEKANGRIVKNYSGPKDTAQLQAEAGQDFLEGDYIGTRYYFDLSEGRPKERPAIPVALNKSALKADGKDTLIVNGLPMDDLNKNPIETIVRIGQQSYSVSDGTAEISVNAPGRYRINCYARNHKPFTFTIEAHDDPNRA